MYSLLTIKHIGDELMTNSITSINTERLEQLTYNARLDFSKLTREVNLCGATITNTMAGRTQPQPSTVASLCSFFGVDYSFLFKPMLELPTLAMRKHHDTSTLVINSLKTQHKWAYEVFDHFQRKFVLPKPEFTAHQIDGEASNDLIRSIARECRFELFRNRSMPLIRPISTLEQQGIPIIKRDFLSKFILGASFLSVEKPMIILNTRNATRCSSRFELACQVAHVVLHNHVSEKQWDDLHCWNLMHKQARIFAFELLMPASAYDQNMNEMRIKEFGPWNLKWGLSIQHILENGVELGLLGVVKEKSLRRLLIPKGWHKATPFDYQSAQEQPWMLQNLLQHDEAYTKQIDIYPRGIFENMLGQPNFFKQPIEFELRQKRT